MRNLLKKTANCNVQAWFGAVVLSLVLVLAGCSASKRTITESQGKKPFPEKIDTIPKVVLPAPMDTIKWVESDSAKVPTIIVDPQPKKEKDLTLPKNPEEPTKPKEDPVVIRDSDMNRYYKDKYKIGVLLPFQAGDSLISSSNRMASWATDFYLGFKLAFDETEPSDAAFLIETFDSKGNELRIDQLIAEGKLLKMDVLVGPYRSNVALKLANYVKENPILLLSPYSANSKIGTGNSHYLQMNPGLDKHLFALFEYGRTLANPDNPVVFLYGTGESELSKKQIWDAYLEELPYVERSYFFSLQIETTELDLKSVDINSIIPGLIGTIVILPSWEEFAVHSVMRKLVAEKLDRQVTLLGMPQWMAFTQLQSAHLESLNVHISSADYYDPREPKMQQLSSKYREAYGQLLNTDAVWGYRCGNYLKEVLPTEGGLFERFILEYNKKPTRLQIPDFRVSKSEEGKVINIENVSIQLLRFQEGTYQIVK
ncbi:MAG: amino acid ABC transporter substrate-binding protein [Saprospiraceae bacterium]|nr:amino acid ABC transporter substrate-binding protein [Saprospiraceae bacterium]